MVTCLERDVRSYIRREYCGPTEVFKQKLWGHNVLYRHDCEIVRFEGDHAILWKTLDFMDSDDRRLYGYEPNAIRVVEFNGNNDDSLVCFIFTPFSLSYVAFPRFRAKQCTPTVVYTATVIP